MEPRSGYSPEELGRRFDRSVSWVSRRVALVEVLLEGIQQQVREGKTAAQIAMRYLAPMARGSVRDCELFAAAVLQCRCATRQAGSRTVRERILAEPALFLKTLRTTPAPASAAMELRRHLEIAVAILHRANRRLMEASRWTVGESNRHNSRSKARARN